MLIPSIDIMNGKLVQMEQGKKRIIEIDNPKNIAKRFSSYALIQVIDLDAAFSTGSNLSLIKEICKIAKCRVGGGIRTVEKAKELIDAGAEKVIIGTRANKEFLSELIETIGIDKIIVALDAKDGNISINGWTKDTGKKVITTACELENYCSEIFYTCIDNEGLLKGGDMNTIKELKKLVSKKVSFGGGISSIKEIKEFDKLGVDCVVGMAIYSGKINPEEAFIDCLNFEKMNSLIPTIVKDKQGNILMLAYSSRESLLRALEMRKGVYFSRSRNKLWIKGETSGNTQDLIEVKTDCDRDALLFIVKQNGEYGACCLKRYSCFQEKKEFGLQALYDKIFSRINSNDEKSYTKKLIADAELLKRKLVEEAAEVITAKNKNELIWECADLLYFLLVIMAREGVTIGDIEKENLRRNIPKSPKFGWQEVKHG